MMRYDPVTPWPAVTEGETLSEVAKIYLNDAASCRQDYTLLYWARHSTL
jgi:hypothetical protein